MIVAVGMVKDEADVIEATLTHLFAQGVDKAIVADNLSTDATRSILESFDQVQVVNDDEFGYYQDRKMSVLAEIAYDQGADWVVPFDADEIIYPTDHTHTLATFLEGLSADVGIVAITGWDHLPRRDDPHGPPFTTMQHRRPHPQRLPKIAFRAVPAPWIHMGNHDVTGVPGHRAEGLALRHFQYRSIEQMARKLRNGRQVYEATDKPYMTGTHWREGGLLTDRELEAKWMALCQEPALFDPCPLSSAISVRSS